MTIEPWSFTLGFVISTALTITRDWLERWLKRRDKKGGE